MANLATCRGTLVGQALGHYRLEEKIGAGGMGEVYRAEDAHLDREVAIKVLLPGTLADDSARKHFRKEALALSKLNHPNIATIYDFDSQEGVDFLAMEYIAGVTLSEKLAMGPLTEKEVLHLGIQLSEGLAAAHEHGVVHRDLKPGNIRVNTDGRLKILDFGLAKLRQPSMASATTESLTESRGITGTLPYMAPEQVLGGEVDARTDIHAAGLVLYEMATGRRPFAEVESGQLIGTILHRAPPAISTINPKLSPELERIIGKCLDKAPENRYQSAKELVIDLRRLERFLEGGSPTSEKEARPRRAAFFSRRRRAGMAVVAILVLGGVTGVVWRKLGSKTAAPATTASIAVLPFVDMSPNHDQEYFSDGLAEEILNTLAKIPNLKVVGRTSSFQFKGKNEDLRVIGQKLNVSNVLEGSVRNDGNHIRITAQLIKTKDGFEIWSDTYERNLSDVFAMQNNIARAVAAALQLNLGPETSGILRQAAETADPEAYRAYLHGLYFSRLYDRDSSEKALQYATQAIQLGPKYALAYALRARILLFAGGMVWMNYADAVQRSRRDAEKAVTLGPDLPDGYRVLSDLQSQAETNCPAAEQTLKKARQLAPTDPDTLALNAMLAMCQGRLEESVELTEQALLFDPLRPKELTFLGQHLRDLGRYDEAYVALQRALDLNPHEAAMTHETLGEVYLAQGRANEALKEMEKEPAGWLHELGLALAYFRLGRGKDSDEALAHLVSQYPDAAAYQIAQVYAYRGQADQAFQWLEHAYSLHDPGLMWLKTDLKFVSIRHDPRYKELLLRMNLT